jgi:hypothetical protein
VRLAFQAEALTEVARHLKLAREGDVGQLQPHAHRPWLCGRNEKMHGLKQCYF